MGNLATHGNFEIQSYIETLRATNRMTSKQVLEALRSIRHATAKCIISPGWSFQKLPTKGGTEERNDGIEQIRDGIEAIKGVLKLYKVEPLIQWYGLETLNLLCDANLRGTPSAIADNAGAQVIVTAMKEHNHRWIQRCACSLLEKMTRHTNDLAWTIANEGVVDAIVLAMQQYHEDHLIQLGGFEVLLALATYNVNSSAKSGLERILSETLGIFTVLRERELKKGFAAGCRALVKLAVTKNLRNLASVEDVICDIVAVMQQNPSIFLEDAGYAALVALANSNQATAGSNVTTHVIKFWKHEPEARFAAGCRTLVQLAQSKHLAQCIADKGVVADIDDTMAKYSKNNSIQDAGCEALVALARLMPTMVSQNLMYHLMHYMRRDSEHRFAKVCDVLVQLASREQYAEMIVSEGVLLEICVAMTAYPNNNTIKEKGCETLKHFQQQANHW